jgi:hypothetical protein
MAVDEESVYWTHGDKVMKVPVTGGSPITLADNQKSPRAIAVDATSVYFGTSDATSAPPYIGGAIMKLTPK